MPVGISLLTLVPGTVGGSETYARELTRALHRVGELDYLVFVPTIARDAGNGLPSRTVPTYRAGRSTPARLAAMAAAALRPSAIRREFDKAELDAMHFPLTVMLPPVDRPPAATSVLDLQHEEHPEFFGRAELAYRKLVYGWTIKRSHILITISEHARTKLIERYELPPERVQAIHLGVDHERFRPGNETREPFLLYPAKRWPHKNHERLLEAFALVRREHQDLRLVLTEFDARNPLPDGVETRGRVSADELARLYRRASLLVFPSLYEGFGLPPLEAMASGCPVAVSRVASLPEICGDAAVYFDPLSPEAIAAGINEGLKRAPELSQRGVERARHFSWDSTARKHEAVYRELAGGRLS